MRSSCPWLASCALLVACGSTLPSFEPLDDQDAPSTPRAGGNVVPPDASPLPPPDSAVPWDPPYDAGVYPPPEDAAPPWLYDAGWLPDASSDASVDAAGTNTCSIHAGCLSSGSVSGSGSTVLGPLTITGAAVSYLGGFTNSTLLTLFAEVAGQSIAFELQLTSPGASPAAPAGDYPVTAWSFGAVPGDPCFSLDSLGTVRVLRHQASALPREREAVSFVGTFSLNGQTTASGSFDLRSACGSALSFE